MHARQIDSFEPKDDITCGVIYLRHPRFLLVVTGPPFSESKDQELAAVVQIFQRAKSDLWGHNRPDCQPRT